MNIEEMKMMRKFAKTTARKIMEYTSKCKLNECKNEDCTNKRQLGSSRCEKCAKKMAKNKV